MIRKSHYILLLFVLSSCSQSLLYINKDERTVIAPPSTPDKELIFQTFLIGDVGAPSLDVQEPVLKLFQSFLEEADEQSAAIFLGDNIYNIGLPDSTHPNRTFYEQRLIEQLKVLENFPGHIVFTPGNHDWDNGGPKGWESVKRQEQFIETYLDRGNTFIPDNGFPGPVTIRLMDDKDHPALREDIRLIVLDTQWWLHKHEKPYGDTGDYNLFDAGDILTELYNILDEQRHDYLMIAAHHPLITHDNHGGYLPPAAHLQPPVFGSFYVLYRRIFGLEQDVVHHRYREMINAFESVFNRTELDNLIYTSGHSHGLQYHREDGRHSTRHYLISGSGSKQSYINHGQGVNFAYGSHGFLIVKYYGDGSVWMEAWAPEGDGSTGTLLYRTQLKAPYEDAFPDGVITEPSPNVDYSDSTITVAANPAYNRKSRLFEWLMGKHNRRYWSIESEFPLFDINNVEGGLTPVRIGGKGQSTTIHLEREDGRDFVIRSVDKRAGRIWSENLRKTFALDVAQDQFSIINPYAALVIPDLADAAGIYHTNPTIFYVPNDQQLGAYTNELSNELALFEERPNGDMSDVESVGYSDEILSSVELFAKIDGDIDHRVDQKAFARARLLDMLLADWDRHSDQWRWASFEPADEKGKLYRPIPRDRDVAMMRMSGLIPGAAKMFGPFFQYQSFSEKYGNLKGLNFNSLDLTRRLTNQVTKSDWIEISEEIKLSLTDEVIDKAVRNYPEPVHDQFGDETARILKARRDQLPDIAGQYYDLISGVVSVPGSNKRELFEVDILNENELRLQVFKLSAAGEQREGYFDRTFLVSETSELRLFGMGGDDRFRLTGSDSNPIKIRMIGGSGADEYVDETPGNGFRKTVEIHDTEQGNVIDARDNTRLKLADIPENVIYNYRSDFRWNSIKPGLFFNFNNKEGFFLGGGPKIVFNGFRRHPSSRHYIRANIAPSTGAANILYDGAWYLRHDATGNRRTELDASFLFPGSYKNFFGLGNETTLEDRSLNFYRARLYQYSIEPRFVFERSIMEVSAGIRFRATNVDADPNNILSDPASDISTENFKEQWFSGLVAGVVFSDIDNTQNPRHGFRFMAGGDLNFGILNTDNNFSSVRSELELYFSTQTSSQFTLANRVGAAHNFWDFPFFEANAIGGAVNLRGFNGRRFSGRSALYNNAELRMELFDFYRYLLGGKVGLNGFFDIGRIWSDGDSSTIWHKGYGGGVWFNAFDSFLINGSVGFSNEDTIISVKTGFFF